MADKEFWIHPDKKHSYYQVSSETGRFILCQSGGSLSSIKSYDSREDAIKDGWIYGRR